MSIQIQQSALAPPSPELAASPGQKRPEQQGFSERAPLEPAYQVSLSEAGQRLGEQNESTSQRAGLDPEGELTPDEQREVQQLAKRDREVRAHEAAHKAAAGSLSSGGTSFGFTTGPDGRRYATSGEVSIDRSTVSGDPDATVRKMQQVRAAALAPASPSSQDRKVAARATAEAQAARADAARADEAGSEPSAGFAASPEARLSDENSNAKTASCSVCGAAEHGAEVHDQDKSGPVDVLA